MSVEVQPIHVFTVSEQKVFAEQLHEHAETTDTRSMLQLRSMHRVIRNLQKDPVKISQQLNKLKGVQETEENFYILETGDNKMAVQGMARVVKQGVAIRSSLPLPAPLVKLFNRDPKNVVVGPHISAWASAKADQSEYLTQAYSQLLLANPGTAGKPAWTFEPGRQGAQYHDIIEKSGFTPKADNSFGGWHNGDLRIVPIRWGNLYIAGSEALGQSS